MWAPAELTQLKTQAVQRQGIAIGGLACTKIILTLLSGYRLNLLILH